MEQSSKPWWASKTVWGGVIAIGAGVAGIFGYQLSPDEQDAMASAIAALGSAIGGGIAVYGRIVAKSDIK